MTQSGSVDSPAFREFLREVENAQLSGFDPTSNKFFPHQSSEGGTPTIAFGHKLQAGEDFSQGITMEGAETLLGLDIATATQQTQVNVDRLFGGGVFASLDDRRRQMLVDFTFNIGPKVFDFEPTTGKAGSTSAFPKFVSAVVNNDLQTAQAESKRSFTDAEGARQPVAERNKLFDAAFLQPALAAQRAEKEAAARGLTAAESQPLAEFQGRDSDIILDPGFAGANKEVVDTLKGRQNSLKQDELEELRNTFGFPGPDSVRRN